MKLTLVSMAALAALSACAFSGHTEHKADSRSQAAESPQLFGSENPYPIHPINLRRTTLVVRDLEKSIPLYRDALGFQVVYDEELSVPDLDARYEADGRNRSRLVLTQTNSSEMGMLGLWQFLDPTEKDQSPVPPADFTPGKVVLLFHTDQLEERYQAAISVAGVKIISALKERRYPSPAGDIVVMVSILQDPDGHTIELNEKIFDPRDPA